MNKYLLVLLLLALNLSANKNWIKLESNDTNNEIQNQTDLKMNNPKSTLKGIKNFNKSKNIQKSHNPDKELLDVIRNISNVAHKIQSKIKK